MSPASDSAVKTKSKMPSAELDKEDIVMDNLRQKQPLQTLPGVGTVEQEESEL